jgi:NAD(P)-dependent dehydrogenase (short-subunit alcohol dehydrogenase family)
VEQSVLQRFRLDGRVAVITGGGGLLGVQHALAIAAAGGIPVLVDVSGDRAAAACDMLKRAGYPDARPAVADVGSVDEVRTVHQALLRDYGRVDILVNNAAHNPKVEGGADESWSRFERFPLAQWDEDLRVGLTGAFVCSQVVGTEMARRRQGVIVNIASDLAVIAPDQRLYRDPDRRDDEQPVKAVSYSVVKTALLGLTRYLATYWADRNVRVNAISPGGVYNGQPEDFVQRLSNLIPLQRMAQVDEYQGALLFLCSDASSYMTGANLVVDGGRSAW